MKLVKFSMKIFLFTFLSIIVVLIGIYVYAFFSPKLELKNMGKIFLYDSSENLIYQCSGSNDWISLDDISSDLKNAVISVEDKSFYHHLGFDIPRIGKALITNFLNNKHFFTTKKPQ